MSGLLRKLFSGGKRREFQQIIKQLRLTGGDPRRGSARPDVLNRTLDGLSRAHRELYRDSVARLHLELALQALAKDNVKEGCAQLARLNDGAGTVEADHEDAAAADMGVILEAALDEEDLGPALDAFVQFRRASRSLVPAFFPFAVKLARSGRRDQVAARAFLEYLACTDSNGQSDDRADVDGALRQTCAAVNAVDSEQLNRLVKATCDRPWARLNLFRLLQERRQFAEAKREYDELRSRQEWPDHQPDWNERAGVVHHALRRWREAIACFDQAETAGGLSPTGRISRIEARVRELDERLPGRADLRSAAAELKTARSELRELLAGGLDGRPWKTAWPLAVQLDRRCLSPRTAWKRLARLDPAARTAPEARREVRLRLLESGLATDQDAFAWGGGVPFDPAYVGRWLLAQGRLGELQRVPGVPQTFGDAPPPGVVPGLLWADHAIRTGRAARVEDGHLTRVEVRSVFPDLALALAIERRLALGDLDGAARLAAGPQSLGLSRLARRLYRGAVARERGDWESAWRDHCAAVAQAPRSPQALVALGLTALVIGQNRPAAQCFARALDAQPKDRYARLGAGLTAADWPAAAGALRQQEPAITLLARPWADRFEAAGRLDLAGRLRGQLGETWPRKA
jgi:tetratricopeptide (TPR) repeat protein